LAELNRLGSFRSRAKERPGNERKLALELVSMLVLGAATAALYRDAADAPRRILASP
jgi:hypothetical protein